MIFLTILFNFFITISYSLASPTLETTSGILTSKPSSTASGVQSFLGVPYAKPPLGPLRFKRPAPLDNKSRTVRDGTQFAPTCIQFPHSSEMINPLLDVGRSRDMSEDCLYLNIYRPENAINLPIVVFIPGEGFDFADASQFDGSILASTADSIVITVQYRVGIFGFLQTKDGMATGNMGLWDIITALKWIKENAASLGGDASKVTLFGRFSGSMASSLLLTSSLIRSESLFSRVILSSGLASPNWAIEYQPETRIESVIQSLGCQDSTCLLTASAEDLLSTGSFGWRPTIDNVIVQSDPLKEVKEGKIASGVREVMLGRNKVDGTLCLLTHWAMRNSFYEKLVSGDVTKQDVKTMLKIDNDIYFGGKLEIPSAFKKIVKSQEKRLRDSYLNFCSSALIHEKMESFANALRKLENVQVYEYEFEERAPESIVPLSVTPFSGHGDDIIYALGLVVKSPEATQTQKQTSRQFMSALGNFFETGDPVTVTRKWERRQAVNADTFGHSNSTSSSTCNFDRKSVVSFFTSHDYSSWQLVNSLSL